MLLDRKIALVGIAVFALLYGYSFKFPPESVIFPRFLMYVFLGLNVILFIFPRENPPTYSFKRVFSRDKVVTILFIIAYVVTLPIVGFFITTFVFAISYMMYYKYQGILRYLAVAAVYILIMYIVFQKFLYIWFPKGFLI